MKDQDDRFRINENQYLLLVDTSVCSGSIQTWPKYPKEQVCYTLAIAQERGEE